jgi:glutamate/tyrosine decarboxylase-like PLP-dependent enzyme
MLNLLGSFTIAWAIIRLSTHTIRRRGRFGPFGDLVVGRHHIHHFVPGIAIAFISGAAGVISSNESLDRWLAIPFGIGTALTLDESALLLELDDVYWSEEGVLSVHIAFTGMTILASIGLARRLLRRGEERVLEAPGESQTATARPTAVS